MVPRAYSYITEMCNNICMNLIKFRFAISLFIFNKSFLVGVNCWRKYFELVTNSKLAVNFTYFVTIKSRKMPVLLYCSFWVHALLLTHNAPFVWFLFFDFSSLPPFSSLLSSAGIFMANDWNHYTIEKMPALINICGSSVLFFYFYYYVGVCSARIYCSFRTTRRR